MGSQLIVCFVIVALDGRVLQGPVHPFDLAVSPGMLRFCQSMVDVKTSAGMLEGVGPDGLTGFDRGFDVRRGRTGIAWRCKMRAVVGERLVDLVRHDRNQPAQEVGRRTARDLFMHFDKDEFGGAVIATSR